MLGDYGSLDVGDHELDWVLDYWRDERPAEPTTNPAKCHSCEYVDVCSATPLHE